jgi:hypothetical protein
MNFIHYISIAFWVELVILSWNYASFRISFSPEIPKAAPTNAIFEKKNNGNPGSLLMMQQGAYSINRKEVSYLDVWETQF